MDQLKYLSMDVVSRSQYNAQLHAVDCAMARLFGKPQTDEERRADLERKEDEFLARKQMEVQNG